MRKEIDEQPAAIRDTLAGRAHAGRLQLDELRVPDDVLREVSKVFVVACGTAFHSGLVAKYAIEHWTRLPVEIEIASEFRYRDPVLGPDTLTLAVIAVAARRSTRSRPPGTRQQGSQVLAVTNTVGSLARARGRRRPLHARGSGDRGRADEDVLDADGRAGARRAVPGAGRGRRSSPRRSPRCSPIWTSCPRRWHARSRSEDRVRAIAERFVDARDVLFIGRHTGYPAALEGALKLKELCYIHASGYPAGELKHGPIALIEDGVPVVAIATRCHVYPKMLSNIQEVKARGASVIAIVTEGDTEAARLADHVIEVPETPELLSPVVVTVPLQLLAYHVAVLRGCDVDQPRNLAKSVTVE